MDAFFSSLEQIPRLGEILALLSAAAWAGAVILFRISGKRVSPVPLNLFKNVIALGIFLLVMPALGKPILPAATAGRYGLLLASGILGIAVSDTLFLAALNILGAGLTAIVDCFYSPFIIILSYFFLGERLRGWQIAGVLLIIAAVLTVARKSGEENGHIRRPDLVRGIVLGILAMLFVAVSIVIIKPILPETEVFWATGVRLAGGILGLLVVLPFHPQRKTFLKPLLDLSNWKAMIPGSILGSFLSLVFWIGGMKFSLASVAAVLNQMNTIFIFILAVVFLKEKATAWKVAAVVMAFVGAFLASFPL